MTSIKLLLVDDDCELHRQWLCELFPQFEIHYANTLDEGIKKALTSDYDVVLLDHHFPEGGDARNFLRAVRKNKPWLQIVLFTGSASYPEVLASLEAGADDYLEKATDSTKRMEISIMAAVLRKRRLTGQTLIIDESRQEVLSKMISTATQHIRSARTQLTEISNYGR